MNRKTKVYLRFATNILLCKFIIIIFVFSYCYLSLKLHERTTRFKL